VAVYFHAGTTTDLLAVARVAGRSVPMAATHIYQMSFFTGFGVSAIIYCALSYVFPPAGLHRVYEEKDVSDILGDDEGLHAETSSIDKKENVHVTMSPA
jgi:nucleobase:cation symporter-1, NCS1 family